MVLLFLFLSEWIRFSCSVEHYSSHNSRLGGWGWAVVIMISHVTFITVADKVSPRLGLEGLVMFKKDTHTFDAENYTITLPNSKTGKEVVIGVFDKVVVEVSIEKDVNTQRGKVKMVLVEPVLSEGI
jgi:hypothetical protein